jgi:hypothetical protein
MSLVFAADAPDWLLIIANLFVVVHMMTAWQVSPAPAVAPTGSYLCLPVVPTAACACLQVFAQPMYETLETNIKAYVIKKRKRAADVYRLPAWQVSLTRTGLFMGWVVGLCCPPGQDALDFANSLLQRLLIRSTYVLLCTLVAALIPFFSAFISFVGVSLVGRCRLLSRQLHSAAPNRASAIQSNTHMPAPSLQAIA